MSLFDTEVHPSAPDAGYCVEHASEVDPRALIERSILRTIHSICFDYDIVSDYIGHLEVTFNEVHQLLQLLCHTVAYQVDQAAEC